MIARLLPWAILANLAVATLLLVGGDVKNATLGLAGAALFGLALMVSEGRNG